MSLYNDLTAVLTPYANKIKQNESDIGDIKENLNSVFRITGKQYGSEIFTISGYINSLGGVSSSDVYTTSIYIPVKQGDVISYNVQANNGSPAIGYYESTSSLTGFTSLVTGTGASAVIGTITIANDGYIRAATHNTTISNNNAYNNAYVNFVGELDEIEEDIQDITDDLSAVSTTVNGYESFFNAERGTEITAQTITLEWTEGSFYNLTTGVITASASMARTEKFPCKAGDVIVVPNHGGQIVFFKSDGTVSYKSGVKTYATVRSAPANTTHFALNNSDSTVRAASVTQKSASEEIIKKTVKAPARLLCDSDMFETGVYANITTGNISTGVSGYYGLANYPVKPNHKYRTQTRTQVVFYDSDMAFISALLPGGVAMNTGTRVEQDFTTPATCAYISINSLSAIEKLFDADEYDIAGFVSNPQKLSGMTVLQFGDSITGNYPFGDNIAYQVEEHTGAKTINCGFGGCRMELLTGDSETAQITNPFAMCAIVDELAKADSDATKWTDQDAAAATFEASPRFNRFIKFRLAILKEVDITNVDVVTIAYGTNEIGYTQYDENNAYNKYTFGGATRYAIEKLLELNPKLRIVLLTPIYRHNVSNTGLDSDEYVLGSTGLSMADNINTLKAVGLEYKIPVIDMYHDLGINALNYASYFGDDDEVDDGTHINSYGREVYGYRLAGELNRLM